MRPLKNSWRCRKESAIGIITASSIRRFHISTNARSLAPAPNSGGSGLDFFKIAADRHALGDMRAVVQFENRHARQRINLEEIRLAIDRLADIDRLERNLNALFGQKYSYTPRIGRGLAIVNLHLPDSMRRALDARAVAATIAS